MIKVTRTSLDGVVIIDPLVHGDERGFFFESFHQAKFAEAGIDAAFVQTNISRSSRGVLRGLHYQHPHAQGKLVTVLEGEVYDVAVDIRPSSPTFGQWTAAMLSDINRRHFWIPPGFAHGFCVVSDAATFMYQCTTLYDPSADAAIRWDDPAIGVDWPVSEPVLSRKDLVAPLLADVPRDRLPDIHQ
jgi:dTDP-4-dehydrorhamnose 3,5-epimerase